MSFLIYFQKKFLFANSIDPDMAPPSATADLGLHCLLRFHICISIYGTLGTNGIILDPCIPSCIMGHRDYLRYCHNQKLNIIESIRLCLKVPHIYNLHSQVGFLMAHIVDGGETMVMRSGRINPQYQGKKRLKVMSYHLACWAVEERGVYPRKERNQTREI